MKEENYSREDIAARLAKQMAAAPPSGPAITPPNCKARPRNFCSVTIYHRREVAK